jgi:hypothetical protein
MGVIDRMRLAAKAAVGIFTGAIPEGVAGEMLHRIVPAGMSAPPPRTAGEFLKAYSTMPWLRAVTHRIATAVASTQWTLSTIRRKGKVRRDLVKMIRGFGPKERAAALAQYRKAAELELIEQHPLLELLYGSNPLLTGLTIRKLTQIYIELNGECGWIKERNAAGAPVGVWPIPAHWVRSTPTVDQPFYEVSWAGWQGQIPDTEILWFSDPDPYDPYARGIGTAQSLADELETDEAAAKHVKSWFLNRARPDLLIYGPGIQKDEVERLEQGWLRKNQGFWRAYKPYFLNREVKVHELSQSFENMQLTELRKHERDIIMQVFGVPPEILGVLQDSNRATVETADYLFSRWVLVPRLEFMRETLQARLVPEYDEGLIIDYVSPVAEDRDFYLQVAKSAPWSRMVDEWREIQGLAPLPDGKGQVFVMGTGTQQNPPAVGETPAVAVSSVGQDLAAQDATKSIQIKQIVDSSATIDAIARSLEPEMRQRFLDAIEAVRASVDYAAVEAALVAGDVAKALALLQLPGLEKALGDAIDAAGTGIGMAGVVALGAKRGGAVAAQALGAALGQTLAFDMTNPQAIAVARAIAGELVTNVSAETRAAINGMVESAFSDGLYPARLAKLIRPTIGLTTRQAESLRKFELDAWAEQLQLHPGATPEQVATLVAEKVAKQSEIMLNRRAILIARTETLKCSNGGQSALWNQAVGKGLLDPKKTRKVWIVAADDRLCPICEDMPLMPENQQVRLNQSFTTGDGAKVEYPPAHPDCRCSEALAFDK